MLDILGHIFIISLFWFVLYWVIGGVLFAAIAIMQVIKLRRARFSCLFTATSALCAFAAAYTGAFYSQSGVLVCLEESEDFFGDLASVIACGIFEQMAAGLVWFLILVGIGLLLFILSRANNQSWIDSEEEEDEFDILEL